MGELPKVKGYSSLWEERQWHGAARLPVKSLPLSAVLLFILSPSGSLMKPMETVFMTSWLFGLVSLNHFHVLSSPWKSFDAVLSDYLFHFFLEKIRCTFCCGL